MTIKLPFVWNYVGLYGASLTAFCVELCRPVRRKSESLMHSAVMLSKLGLAAVATCLTCTRPAVATCLTCTRTAVATCCG